MWFDNERENTSSYFLVRFATMALNPSTPVWLTSLYPTNVFLAFSNHFEMLAYFFRSMSTAWKWKRTCNDNEKIKGNAYRKTPQRSRWKRPEPSRRPWQNCRRPKRKIPRRFPKIPTLHRSFSPCRRFSALRQRSKDTVVIIVKQNDN